MSMQMSPKELASNSSCFRPNMPLKCIVIALILIKGNTKFWHGVMNLVEMNILEAYAILQYSVIVVAVDMVSKVMKLLIMNTLCCIAPSQGRDIN